VRFDWYQTTVHEKPSYVIEQLKKLGHEVRNNDSAAKAYRYSQGWEVHHNVRGVVARVFAGSNGIYPHALASSDETDSFVDLVRNEWPDSHLVTRMDAAQDFNEAGSYPRLRRVARRVAKAHRLCFHSVEDRLNPTSGRTQYIASPKSEYRARLYEKGWEQVAKISALFKGDFHPSPSTFIHVENTVTGEFIEPANWIRLELQARPKGEEARRLAAVATPEQAWAFTDWSQHLAREALELDLERFYMRSRKVSKDEEALRWMCQQYGKMLSRLKDDVGNWDCAGLEIGRIVEEQRRKQ
jgi:hypothetical protein